MKRIVLWLVAMIATVMMSSASPIYIRGEFNSWKDVDAYKMEESEVDGKTVWSWVGHIDAGKEFKFCIDGTTWLGVSNAVFDAVEGSSTIYSSDGNMKFANTLAMPDYMEFTVILDGGEYTFSYKELNNIPLSISGKWSGTSKIEPLEKTEKNGIEYYTWTGELVPGASNDFFFYYKEDGVEHKLGFKNSSTYWIKNSGSHLLVDDAESANILLNTDLYNTAQTVTFIVAKAGDTWQVSWGEGIEIPEKAPIYNLYIRGAYGDNWDVQPERYLAPTVKSDGSVEYTSEQFDFTMRRKFRIGTDEAFDDENEGWRNWAVSLSASELYTGSETFRIIRANGSAGSRTLPLNSGSNHMIFTYTMNGVLKVINHADGTWTMEWDVPEVAYDIYDFGVVDANSGWNDKSPIATFKGVRKDDGSVEYTADVTIKANDQFKIATEDWNVDLSASSMEGVNREIKMADPQPITLYLTKKGDPESMGNMYFAEDYSGRITVVQNVSGAWSMTFTSDYSAKACILHSSEFNNDEAPQDFEWDPEQKVYVLRLKYVSNATNQNNAALTSTVLTNRFWIEYDGTDFDGVFDDQYRDNGRPIIPTGVPVQIKEGGSSFQLADRALQNAVITFDPETMMMTVTGDPMPMIDAREYTIYYEIGDGEVDQDVYLWAWGNSQADALHLTTLGSTTFPGVLISDADKKVTMNGKNYYEIKLTVPAGNSSIAVLFSHSKDDQGVNIADYDFYDGKIYSWSGVVTEAAMNFSLCIVDSEGEVTKHTMTKNAEDGKYYLGTAESPFVAQGADADISYFYVTNAVGENAGINYSSKGGVAYGKTYPVGVMSEVNAENGMQLIAAEKDQIFFVYDSANKQIAVHRLAVANLMHYTLFFLNNSATNFTAPHIKVYSADEENPMVFTANVSGYGEPMLHDDVAINRDEAYWRYDLYIPASFRLKKGNAQDPSSNIVYSGEEGNSGVHIEISDAGNNVAKFNNARLVDGGTYVVDDGNTVPTLNGMLYLYDGVTHSKILELEETTPGVYIFENDKGLTLTPYMNQTTGIVKLYVTNGTGTAATAYWGAESGEADITDEIKANQTDFPMVQYSAENKVSPFEINLKTLGYDDSTFYFKVEVNPTTGYASFGIGKSLDDIDTAVEGIEAEDAPVYWFTLQGVRVAEPSEGLYIRVQGNKAVKVLVK